MEQKEQRETVTTTSKQKDLNGNQKEIAFVFLCPGQEELKLKEILAGETGTNFNTLLQKLNSENSYIFKSDKRDSYYYTNIIDEVYYKGYHSGGSVPKKKEICTELNERKKTTELKNFKYIIACSPFIYRILKSWNLENGNCKLIKSYHLGLQCLNRAFIYKGFLCWKKKYRNYKNDEENTLVNKLDKLADYIIKQL